MNEFRARVGRIRMKNGGADVRVLHRQERNPDGENWQGKIIENARQIAATATDDNPLIGYVQVGIFPNGTSVAWRYDWDGGSNQIPRMMLPHWIAEVIRRDLIMDVEARDIFNEMFQWVDG